MARWSGTSFSAPVIAGLIAREVYTSGSTAHDAANAVLASSQYMSDPAVGPSKCCDSRTTPDFKQVLLRPVINTVILTSHDDNVHDQPDPDLTALASSKVIAIGYWRDQAETYWPDVTDFVDNTVDDRSRALVVERLRAGTVVRHYRGASTCRMCGQPNGTAEFTDGDYLWPEGRAHYIDKHHVRLPTRVETHFAANKYVKRTGAHTPEIGDSWWLALGNFSWETND